MIGEIFDSERHGKVTTYTDGGNYSEDKIENEIWENDKLMCELDITEKGKEHAFYDTNMDVLRADLSHWEMYTKPNANFKGMWDEYNP